MCRGTNIPRPTLSPNGETASPLSDLLPLVQTTAGRLKGASSTAHSNTSEKKNISERKRDEHPEPQNADSPKSHSRFERRRSLSDESLSGRTEKGHKRTYVHHDYHDFSHSMVDLSPTFEKKGRGGVSSMFPVVLHNMLEHSEQDAYSHIVSWQPHGRAFHVHNQDKFVSDIMPRFFRHTRFSSFQRQLSLYGFTRLTRKGPDRGCYYHELFLRGKAALCNSMHRTRIKGTQVRQAASPDTEPDFYSMQPVGPIPPVVQQVQSMQHPSAAVTVLPFNETVSAPVATASAMMTTTMANPFTNSTFTNSRAMNSSVNNMQSRPLQGNTNDNSKYRMNVPYRPSSHVLRNNFSFSPYWSGETATDYVASNQFFSKKRAAKNRSTKGELPPLETPIGDETDLALFLSEVDLDSGDKHCLDSEEGLARILERDLQQKYAV